MQIPKCAENQIAKLTDINLHHTFTQSSPQLDPINFLNEISQRCKMKSLENFEACSLIYFFLSLIFRDFPLQLLIKLNENHA